MTEPQSKSIIDQFVSLLSRPETALPPLPEVGQVDTVILETAQPQPEPDQGLQQSLSKLLIQKDYHPVLIFGTRASGKSTLLTSLFSYFQTDPQSGASCYLGDWIIPVETVEGSLIADEASRFFNRVVSEFHGGKAAETTQFQVPFFIPIVVKPNTKKPTVKVAILESSGEFYQVNTDSARYHPELRAEIKDVYENYPGPLSIIIIAPYIMSEAYSGEVIVGDKVKEEFRLSDDALLASLQNYQRYRKNPDNDRMNFLLTKWDVHTEGLSDRKFVEPPPGLVEHLIRERFPKSWISFGNLTDASSNAMGVMPYSAGLISGNDALPIPPAFKGRMNIFPNKLWNWIYLGASNGKALYGNAQYKGKKTFLKKIFDLFF